MNLQRLTILIVDDNAHSSEIIAEHLTSALKDAVIVNAPDGSEALRMLRQRPIDLVITDEVMPKKSGTDLIKDAAASGVNCPFIILTGLRSQDVPIEKRNAHRVRLLEKPTSGSDLLQLVQVILADRKTA
jgi:DNA-binding response OmpR family regulator